MSRDDCSHPGREHYCRTCGDLTCASCPCACMTVVIEVNRGDHTERVRLALDELVELDDTYSVRLVEL